MPGIRRVQLRASSPDIGWKGKQDESNKTTWHTVLAFRERVARVRDHVKKGDGVEVIGYKHLREVPGREGPRTIEEIHAAVVKPR